MNTMWLKFAVQNTLRNRRRSLVTVSIQRRPIHDWQPKAAKVSRPVDTSSITPCGSMTKVTSDTTPNNCENVDGSKEGSFML